MATGVQAASSAGSAPFGSDGGPGGGVEAHLLGAGRVAESGSPSVVEGLDMARQLGRPGEREGGRGGGAESQETAAGWTIEHLSLRF